MGKIIQARAQIRAVAMGQRVMDWIGRFGCDYHIVMLEAGEPCNLPTGFRQEHINGSEKGQRAKFRTQSLPLPAQEFK